MQLGRKNIIIWIAGTIITFKENLLEKNILTNIKGKNPKTRAAASAKVCYAW